MKGLRWFIGLVILVFAISLLLQIPHFLPQDKIGYVEIKGTIFDAKKTVEWIKELRKNPRVKAILLTIDSPGGGVAASYEIYDALIKTKKAGKPIVATLSTLAASGGYYIACAADSIIADPGTITGSIGVIMEFPIMDNLLKKIGIGFETIKSSEYKDIGSPFRPMTDAERELLKGTVQNVYQQFVDIVVKSRRLPKEEVLKIADGRILSGAEAKELGLVDRLGTEEDALEVVQKLVKKPLELLKPPKRKWGIWDLVFGYLEELLVPVRLAYLPEDLIW